MAALLGSRLNGRPLSDGDAPDGFAAENGRANTPHLRGKSFGRTAGNAVLQRQCNIGLSLRVSVLIVPMASCPCPHVISPWFLCVPSPLTSLITPLVVPLPPPPPQLGTPRPSRALLAYRAVGLLPVHSTGRYATAPSAALHHVPHSLRSRCP